MILLAHALESLDAAIGRPYEAQPMRKRVAAWLPACRGLPDAAITWAADTACARLEKYPTAAQFRSLAQGSPAWADELKRRRPSEPTPPADVDACDECGEARAYHRIRPYADAPRPIVIRGIRHRSMCSDALRDAPDSWWYDPATYGTLGLNDEAWRVFDPTWEPPSASARRSSATAPVSTPGGVTMSSDADRAERADAYKQAAKGETA